MPFDLSTTINYGFPTKQQTQTFGGGNGNLWALIKEVNDLVATVVEKEVECAREGLSEEKVRDLIEKLIKNLNACASFQFEKTVDVLGETTRTSPEALIDQYVNAKSEDSNSQSNVGSLEDVKNQASDRLVFDIDEDVPFQQFVLDIAKSKSWNESLPEIAIRMLIQGSSRSKVRIYPASDAYKPLLVLLRYAGLKFINPNEYNIARNFIYELLEKSMIKESPSLRNNPAKTVGSIASNHPTKLVRLPYTRLGSTREAIAFGLTSEGLNSFEKDMLKLGLYKNEIQFLQDAIRDHIVIPSDISPEWNTDPDTVQSEG